MPARNIPYLKRLHRFLTYRRPGVVFLPETILKQGQSVYAVDGKKQPKLEQAYYLRERQNVRIRSM